MHEPKSIFGQVKNNRGSRRFLLRGLRKVSLEVGWLPLAHNFLKVGQLSQQRKIIGQVGSYLTDYFFNQGHFSIP
jgi:hypothetical protein